MNDYVDDIQTTYTSMETDELVRRFCGDGLTDVAKKIAAAELTFMQ